MNVLHQHLRDKNGFQVRSPTWRYLQDFVESTDENDFCWEL